MEGQNKTFDNGVLLKVVLIPKLLNKPFASCSFNRVALTNLDLLILQAKHFDCITNLLFFVLTIFGSIFFVSFLHFMQ